MSTLHRNPPAVHSAPAPVPCPEAATWPAWTDDVRYRPADETAFDGPDPDDADWWAGFTGDGQDWAVALPLTFAGQIRTHATFVRNAGTASARWLAAEMDALAEMAEALHATTPDEFDGRFEASETAARQELYYNGFDRGYADGKNDALRLMERG